MQGTDQIFEVFLQGIASKNVFMDIVYGIFPRQIITIVDDQSFPRATETPKRMTTEPALETLASVLAQTLNPGTRQQGWF